MQCKKFCNTFSWKIHFFQTMADIVEPFLWEVVEKSYFNLVYADCSNCCSVGTVFAGKCSKNSHFWPEKGKKKKEKKVKHLMRVPEFYWYLIHLTLILVRELSFRRKNMTYKMVQNLAWSDRWIKQSTFWPTSIRVFGLNSYQKGLNCCNFLTHHLIMLHLFVTPFLL